MCPGTFGPNKEPCPMRDTCYRFIAEPDAFWQSYFSNGPGAIDATGDFYCESYWPTVKRAKEDPISNDETYD